MKNYIRGKAYVLGDDVDTDQIIPAEYLVLSQTELRERILYGRYALSGVPAAGAGMPWGGRPFVRPNEFMSDFSIVIGGKNFGCGSSREHAPFALAQAGVQAVVANFYARIFYRNSVNGGYLLPLETQERLCETIRTGEELEISLDESLLRNLTSGREYALQPPGEILPILEAGDLFAYAKQTGMLAKA